MNRPRDRGGVTGGRNAPFVQALVVSVSPSEPPHGIDGHQVLEKPGCCAGAAAPSERPAPDWPLTQSVSGRGGSSAGGGRRADGLEGIGWPVSSSREGSRVGIRVGFQRER